MKPYFFIIAILIACGCSSYKRNMRHIKKHPDEIVAFKKYLENTYSIHHITTYETIWGTANQPDTVISNFCSKNNILSIAKLPQKSPNQKLAEKSSYSIKGDYENVVRLYFNYSIYLEDPGSVVFDYTENGLDSLDASLKKYKIAERIYIIR